MVICKRYLSHTERKRIRISYSKNIEFFSIPCLLSIQLDSYDNFLHSSNENAFLRNLSLDNVFKSIFPLSSYTKYNVVEYLGYSFDNSFFSINECRLRNKTFAASLKIKIRLLIYDRNYTMLEKVIKSVIEQEVYVCEIPLMTKSGTFVINGVERVVVSQLHRSPGVLFESTGLKYSDLGKVTYTARIIPYRGSWVEFELDYKEFLYVHIDKKKKLSATILLKALGYNVSDILSLFYDLAVVRIRLLDFVEISIRLRCLCGEVLKTNVFKDGFIILYSGVVVTKKHLEKYGSNSVVTFYITNTNLYGHVIAKDILLNMYSNKVLVYTNTYITENILNILKKEGVKSFYIVYYNNLSSRESVLKTLRIDAKYSEKIDTKVEALLSVFKTLRPSEHATIESANNLFNQLFFDLTRYDLSDVGVFKFNCRLGGVYIKDRVLTKLSIVYVIKTLLNVKNGYDIVDDIDHMGNRRIRSVGELVENQFRVGFTKVERTIKERLTYAETEMLTPRDLINTKPVSSLINEFFCSNQLSQYMDQTNPLSCITHKRRISALGLGGLTRERAGFEVRDVHYSQYGRLCPVETPEGPNIGLINSLALYARVNQFGFLETPYCRVRNRKITKDITYLTALEETGCVIAQSNIDISKDGYLLNKYLLCRYGDEFKYFRSDNIDYIDVSTKQIVSVAAALIPFLEHDDANRVLMGSNMQKQAVPLLHTEKPLVGTGMEKIFIQSSGDVIISKNSGVVSYVDSKNIVVMSDIILNNVDESTHDDIMVYTLTKYNRTNQNTCLNQKIIVDIGATLKKYDILADTTATDLGDLAIGKNILVAFMSWYGYNFEDSIVLSERLVHEDTFTSLHIEEFICTLRDTHIGPEEITCDLPDASAYSIRNLNSAGIVYIGASVTQGDILVGKTTPVGETQLTPEEKLLRAIFGEKVSSVKDTSLRAPLGEFYTVVDVKVYTRLNYKKEYNNEEDNLDFLEFRKTLNIEFNLRKISLYRDLKRFLIGKELHKCFFLFKLGSFITQEYLKCLPKKEWFNIILTASDSNNIILGYFKKYTDLKNTQNEKINSYKKFYKKCDNLIPGVLKIIKVFLAYKRTIKVGDKMSGRHGNKGVISTIIPIGDMPYLEDGTPIDMILNPLSVPSRMNIGQIFETHLGLAMFLLGNRLYDMYTQGYTRVDLQVYLDSIYKLCCTSSISKIDFLTYTDCELYNLLINLKKGIPVETHIFNGITEDKIKLLLRLVNYNEYGQVFLYDGFTGNVFEKKITIGYVYILKLNHLVDDKMHARSIGSYSLITQQPLGGKAQFGGQRFGEMEVWALEAYGAAYTLQELLTVKSDDVTGRVRIYKNIIDNDYFMFTGVPESFNVLVNEIRSLGLDIEFV